MFKPVNISPLKMVAAIIIILTSNLMVLAEGSPCTEDHDCPESQYCYETSSCANYTSCQRYNRLERDRPVRHHSQCGPCVPGFTSQVYTNGEEICLLSVETGIGEFEAQEPKNTSAESGKYHITMWISLGTVVIVATCLLLLFMLRKRPQLNSNWTDQSWGKSESSGSFWRGMYSFGPSAPPFENGVIPVNDAKVINYDVYGTDRNQLVAAVPFKSPDWISVGEDYDQIITQPQHADQRSGPPLDLSPEEDTTPSSWTPEQTTVQIPSRPFVQFSNEERENTINSRQLIEENCPASSSLDSTNPAAEPGAHDSDSNNVRAANILISQKITVNLNVMNDF